MYKQEQFQNNGNRNDKDIKDKRILKGKWSKEHWKFDKRKVKKETGLRDNHFIIIYIHIIIVIINSSSSNDYTDGGEWVEIGNTCWYQFVRFCLGKWKYWYLFEEQLLEGIWELKIFSHFMERDGFGYVCIIWDAVSTGEVQDLSFVIWKTQQLYCIESLHPLGLHMMDTVLRVAIKEMLCRSNDS
jgi:hypothetical protein